MSDAGEPDAAGSEAVPVDPISAAEDSLAEVASIPVHISYEIIRLFSEGLYQSPQKAVEELVSNSYDAGATSAHVLLPDSDGHQAGSGADTLPPLWVIDNGSGLDAAGFTQLWRVADSAKSDVTGAARMPIGQFGIGKLAAYVLAWRLTHISKVDGVIRFATMNFRRLQGTHQYNSNAPIDLSLKEIDEERARRLMADIEVRDPAAWALMFGSDSSPTWTAAALSDFKELYDKLGAGRLEWVLRTGLPLHSDFRIWQDGKPLESSKEQRKTILTFVVGSDDDTVAESLGLEKANGVVIIPGIEGSIAGEARVYEKRVTEGKSDQYGRSHGFFVRVRERVVNLEDELFGLDALNHATWARFSMEVSANGLREHLLSSREGVRESDSVNLLKKYLHAVFNVCRNAYDKWAEAEETGLDVRRLLSNAPSAFVSEPMVEGVRAVIAAQEESYYVSRPVIPEGVDPRTWLADYAAEVQDGLFADVVYESTGPFDRAIRYFPDTRRLLINVEHPFIEKLLASGRNRAAATLFGSSELLIDALLQDYGLPRSVVINLLSDRDRVLRLVAGDEPSTAAEVVRLLKSAMTHETALERAVGMAFRVLGFEYEKRGGNAGGPDGVLYARLGRGSSKALDDYKIVYDAKQTNKPSVPADKISIASLDDFRRSESAQFAFFIATEFEGQGNETTKLNRMIAQSRSADKPVVFLRVDDLQRLVELHYRYGVTLTRLRDLFQQTRSVPEVTAWLNEVEAELSTQEPQVPLLKLLETLEKAKSDEKQVPSVTVARLLDTTLYEFHPERLQASLSAMETIVGKRWLEVDQTTGEVRLHGTAGQIVAEVERNLRSMYGVDALERSEISEP